MQTLIEFLANHWILTGALVTVLVLMVANEIWTALRGEKRLLPLEAVRLINDKNALVLDVRSPADFKKGHILNALNIPAARIEERAGEIAKFKDRPVICYCALGTVAPAVCAKLRQQGFATVYSLKGGLNAWQGASLPVTTK
ncbi:MAG TPA: rhodanese-like domain-containing protein [Nevskiales bacterium]|nr:rhodanese-like domain-containing protein [Nevskiales bacterium]